MDSLHRLDNSHSSELVSESSLMSLLTHKKQGIEHTQKTTITDQSFKNLFNNTRRNLV